MADASGADVVIRVIVAAEDVLSREGLAGLLDRWGFDVVGRADGALRLPELVRTHEPDLVLIHIPDPSDHPAEYEAARSIRTEFPNTGVLVLCARVEVRHAIDALAGGGGISYLLTSRITDIADFVDILKRIARGACIVGPAVAQALVSAREDQDSLATLSAREHDVLRLMAEGRSNDGIARRLYLAEGTIEKHVHNIFTKLGITETRDDHRRVQAVIAFLRGEGN
ncbi:DNA-binding response regulator [Mycobacterium sp. NS-7484]|uniref:response regulator transcription factor n=1 Tax=Mycobacterium sp. NS-7484 TaxID=1834161 RepID=UPI00096EF40C|nr:response regulator transcription factor [Mycobacterium sp. NS-7484]OMC00117.1 DNA-binding response regulator [Mycobacterium sp. NS-7484]